MLHFIVLPRYCVFHKLKVGGNSALNKPIVSIFPTVFITAFMTQRDGMGREDGGGYRMGNTCIPVVDSF